MFFRKRRRPLAALAVRSLAANAAAGTEQELYYIAPEMLLKGAHVRRGRTEVRQFGVMIRGAVRMVTSGDTVEKDVYKALLDVGAIAPPPAPDVPEAACALAVEPKA